MFLLFPSWFPNHGGGLSQAEGPSDSQASREEIHIWQPRRSHFPPTAGALHSLDRYRETVLLSTRQRLGGTSLSTRAQEALGTHTEFCGDVADGEGWHDSHWYLTPVETVYCSLGRRCMKLHNVFFIVFHP